MIHSHQSAQSYSVHPGYFDNLSNEENQNNSNIQQQIDLTKTVASKGPTFKQPIFTSYLPATGSRLFVISIFASLLIVGWRLLPASTPSFQLPDALASELPKHLVLQPDFETNFNQQGCAQDIDLRFAAVANVLDYLLSTQSIVANRPSQEKDSATPVILNSQPISISQNHPTAMIEDRHKTDLPVVEVAVQKANLRIGPGLDQSPLMVVSSGTRLVVETEQNGWYRVTAPSGSQAWISSSVVNPIS